jgi:cell division protein FtsA
MLMRKKDSIICALDVGTDNTTLLLARLYHSGKLEMLESGFSHTRGLTKGIVVNLEEAADSIRRAVEEVESKTNISIGSVVAGISGNHIMSHNFSGAIEIKGKHGEVTAKDMESAIRAASIPLSQEREIIHILPKEFLLNGQGGIKNPVGLAGPQLDINLHVVSCDGALNQSLINAANKTRIKVKRVILQSIASGEAVLTPEEKELGCAVIDIGCGTTDIALYVRGSIYHTSVIPVAGSNFTYDLVEAIHTSREEAERIKIEFGSVLPEQIEPEEMLDIKELGSHETRSFSRKEICEVFYDRGAELLELIKNDIFRSVTQDKLIAGAILTGGGSQMKGMIELAERILQIPVRPGIPMGFEGLTQELAHPTYSCAVGLILFEAGKTEIPHFFGKGPSGPSLADRFLWFLEK